METIKGILKLIKSVRCDGIVTCNIAEIQKCREASDNLRGYMASNGSKVDLYGQMK